VLIAAYSQYFSRLRNAIKPIFKSKKIRRDITSNQVTFKHLWLSGITNKTQIFVKGKRQAALETYLS